MSWRDGCRWRPTESQRLKSGSFERLPGNTHNFSGCFSSIRRQPLVKFRRFLEHTVTHACRESVPFERSLRWLVASSNRECPPSIWDRCSRYPDCRWPQTRRRSHVLEGRRADLPGQVSELSRAGIDRADVAHDLRGSAAVGEVDSASASRRARCRRGTSTAASASRSSRTTCRSPTSRSQTIVDWVDQGARAGQPGRHAAAQAGRDDAVLAGRARRLRAARPRREVARVHDAGGQPGSVVAPDRSTSRASPSRAGCGWSKSARPTSRAARSCITRSRTSCWIPNDAGR